MFDACVAAAARNETYEDIFADGRTAAINFMSHIIS